MNLRMRVFWGDRFYVSRIFSPKRNFSIGNTKKDSFYFDIRPWRLFSKASATGVTFHKLANLNGYLKHTQSTKLFRKMEAQPSSVSFSQEDTLYFSLGDTHFYFDWVSERFPIPKKLFSPKLVLSGVVLLAVSAAFYSLTSNIKPPVVLVSARKEFSVALERKVSPPPPAIPAVIPIPSPAPQPVSVLAPVPKKIVPALEKSKPNPAPVIPQVNFDQLSESFENISAKRPAKGVPKAHRILTDKEAQAPLLNTESLGEITGRGNGKYILQATSSAKVINQNANSVETTFDVGPVDKIVRAHQNQIRGCYEKSLPTAELEGELMLSFTLNSAGKVTWAEVSKSPGNNSMVASCIVRQVKGWVFPANLTSQPITLQYPIQLSLKK